MDTQMTFTAEAGFGRSTLEDILVLSKSLQDLKEAEGELEAKLSEIKQKALQIETELLPQKFNDLGIKELSLANGRKIKVRDEVFANISKDRAAAAFAWLREHGAGGMITTQLITSHDYEAVLIEHGVEFEKSEKVHAMTLRKYVREVIEAGEDVPRDLLGVHIQTRAEIK